MQSKQCSLGTTALSALLTLAVLLAGHGRPQSAQAQPDDASVPIQQFTSPNPSSLSPPAGPPRQRYATSVSPPASDASSRFGNALVGSTIGTVVGGTLGVLAIRGANNDEFWERQEETVSGSCCAAQRLGLGLLGVGAAAGGGPYGAAQRLDQNGAAFYAASVSGQVLLGGLGYALGSALGGDDGRVIGGLALGVPLAALGAAGGAVLESRTASGMKRAGGLRFDGNQWRVGMPDVRIRPDFRTDRGVVARVTVFSAQLD